MTEHAAVIFVFFFLAEYASILLICILTSILFLAGYLINSTLVYNILHSVYYPFIYTAEIFSYSGNSHKEYLNELYSINPILEGAIYGLTLGYKSCLMVFVFIWTRASFPRIRYDQLMSFCWTILLPLIVAIIIFIPCILYNFYIIPVNIYLF